MAKLPTNPNTSSEENALVIQDSNMLAEVVKLARESRGVSPIDLVPPEGAIGLPAKIPAFVRFGDKPEIVGVFDILEKYRTAPDRRTGTARVTTLQSFIDLVIRHKTADSAIFAKTAWPQPDLIAVIDYHQIDGTAQFGRHKIQYSFPLTDEFKVWMAQNGKFMGQAEFAYFLEEHAAELSAPYDGEKSEFENLFKEKFGSPNEIIRLSRDLEVFVGMKVKRQERIQSGERTISFQTEHSNANGDRIDIPGIFMVSVAAFIDGDALRIPARLRYRVSEGAVIWGYQLYRPESWVRTKVKEDLDTAANEAGIPAFEGSPEAA